MLVPRFPNTEIDFPDDEDHGQPLLGLDDYFDRLDDDVDEDADA
jgi:hypothetical protein